MAVRSVAFGGMAVLLIVSSLGVPGSALDSRSESWSVVTKLTASLESHIAGSGPTTLLPVIIQFTDFATAEAAPLSGFGAHVVHRVGAIPAVFAWVPAVELPVLAALPEVLLVEFDEPLEYDMDTAILAGNVAPLWAVAQPNVTIDGRKIDGTGVTVAVVDTGVNAVHDDIKYQSKTIRNLLAVGIGQDQNRQTDPFTGQPLGVLQWRETEDSDGGGHGSHVAGIVAGNGALGNGKYRGSAPGASLVGLGSKVGSFWYAVAAWDWVFQNHDKVTPNIRIITNSWGYATGMPCDEAISLTKIQKRLVLEADVTMFFSAGNTGGDGTKDSTRTQFKCPWEGNIGVGNYFDQNSGTRDGYQSNSSSRGLAADPATWPDVSAPGTSIMATNGYPPSSGATSYLVGCQVARASGVLGSAGCYRALSGTSMATPFTAGVGALILQARPDLKPADVEYILEQTAYQFANPFDAADGYYADPAMDYRSHGSHFFRGHGLVDAEAAVRFALAYNGTQTPVVYGEKEQPKAETVGRAKVAAQPSQAGTPGLEAIGALAGIVLGAVAVAFRRRD